MFVYSTHLTKSIWDKIPLVLRETPNFDIGVKESINISINMKEDPNIYLLEQNYIFGVILFNNKVYMTIHGFPGDNPNGVIYNNYNDSHKVGEMGMVDPLTSIQKWYIEVTEEVEDGFDKPQWYGTLE